jgi:ATP-binding cassette subfamily B protein RaxB
LIQVAGLSLAIEAGVLATPLLVRLVADAVVPGSDHDFMTLLGLGFGAIAGFQALATAARSWSLSYIGTSLSVQGRSNILSHLLRLPLDFFERRNVADLVSRFRAIDQIQSLLSATSVEAAIDGALAIGLLVVLYLYSPSIAAVAILAIGLSMALRWVWHRSIVEATASQVQSTARHESHFLESVRGIAAIKLLQRETERQQEWLSQFIDQANANASLQRYMVASKCAQQFVHGLEKVAIVWVCANLVMAQELTLGAMMVCVLYNSLLSARAVGFAEKVSQFKVLGVYTQRLADIVLEKEEMKSDVKQEPAESDVGRVLLSNVWYKYGEGEAHVLKGISFSVAPGESVAVTGPSGGGKSTLVSMIVGLRLPSSGDVRIGGISPRYSGPDAIRSQVGAALQDDSLLTGTILQNIACFDTAIDEEWAIECARRACIHRDIISMPMKYHTMVGEMGSALSAGQKQRILLARALYRRPSVLVLDEGTSHLDVETERLVAANLRDMKITRILVAHRPETIKSADRRIVIVAGQVTHDSGVVSGEEKSAARASNNPSSVHGAES